MPDTFEQILTNAASGLSAQNLRMNTIASNLANAGNVGGSESATYRTKYPIFSEVTKAINGLDAEDQPIGGVQVTGVQHTKKPLEKKYEPDHPLANADGYVYQTDVNPIAEMTNMISASKDYQANIEIMNTTKNMLAQTIAELNNKY